MYVIRIKLRIKPEMKAAFSELAETEAQHVRNEFDGCLSYGFWSSLREPHAVLIYQEWQDTQSFERYRDSEYLGQLRQKLLPLLAEKPESAYYSASRVGP